MEKLIALSLKKKKVLKKIIKIKNTEVFLTGLAKSYLTVLPIKEII